ncbi:hypothetical protein [Formosa sp. PL04]|uniref:WD40 repeat domain-containing protein n=1 Tax=Formosa sp. PL04 TaxID=3081755 RepID=UPI002980A8BB|nr:hypothetical protein [Formosa sp. PL04]MDW5290805.1 hypothetical protein [Formosa sp. PL04]
MTFNTICDSESPKVEFYKLLKILAIDIESEAVLKSIVEGAENFSMEEDTLVVEMMSGDNLYIYPPEEGKTYAKQPPRFQELISAFSGLSYPEEDDLGLHFGAFEVDSEFPELKQAFAPIQEYDNWYYYNSENELCYISHEGGSGARAKYTDTGVNYLYELAQLLFIDLDEIRAALPFESHIKLVKTKEYLSFREARDTVAQVKISPDGNIFSMSGDEPGSVQLVTSTGEMVLEYSKDSMIFPTAFSSCGSYFAFGSRDRKITVIDMASMEVKWVFYGDDDRIEPEVLADETLKKTVGASSGHNRWLISLTFSLDNNILFSGSNGIISGHNCETGTLLFTKTYEKKKRSWVNVLEIINEEELLISSKEVKTIMPSTQKTVHKFPISDNGLLSGTVSKDKKLVVLSHSDTQVFKSNGEKIRKISVERAFALAISSDNSMVAMVRDAPCVDIVSIEGELLCRLLLGGEQNSAFCYSIEFIDNKTLLVGFTSGVVELKIEGVL